MILTSLSPISGLSPKATFSSRSPQPSLRNSEALPSQEVRFSSRPSTKPLTPLVDYIVVQCKASDPCSTKRDSMARAVSKILLRPENEHKLLNTLKALRYSTHSKGDEAQNVAVVALLYILEKMEKTGSNPHGKFDDLIHQFVTAHDKTLKIIAAPAVKYISDEAHRDELIEALSKEKDRDILAGAAQVIHYHSNPETRQALKEKLSKHSYFLVRINASRNIHYQTPQQLFARH